ncbi:SRPBCC family protein [Microbacterium sp. F2E]|uniref:SRPBCC family protein n=1 Tax=Microbacterium TaxID=33882 RepID=UPI001E5A1A03|nr:MULTISPECIES: SRPBCC family protein [Microbacterium]MCC9053892.1 SRPBCC family protein [Microbacterium sp. F2E]
MPSLTAHRDVHADPHTIAGIILNIAELADWNPALNSADTQDRIARIGHPYPVSTRVPGRASLTYLHADPERITWRLQVTGGTETGEWELQPNGETTRVVHTMTHDGAFFALMRHAMHQVPNWRLDRLQQRAEQHH